MSRLFSSPGARASFRRHLGLATPFVRLGVCIALLLRLVLGERAGRLPVVKIAVSPLEALVAMHNASDRADDSSSAAPRAGTTPPAPPMPDRVGCHLDSELVGRTWDLVVAGSGPGGAATAAAAAARGEAVLLVEAGAPPDEVAAHHSVAQMMSDFAYGGQELALGPSPVPYAQGRVLGGGSEVNSGLYHRIPSPVLPAWSAATGLAEVDLVKAADLVEQVLPVQVQPTSSLGCYDDSPVEAIREALDWEGGVIPRWRDYTVTPFVHFGMTRTYLARAAADGAQTVLSHRVVSVRPEGDGVLVSIAGESCSHEMRAVSVCLAAGVIGTPEVLRRSGLARAREFSFHFHAMVREVAEFDRVVNDLEDIDPHQAWTPDNRFKVGAAVSTPELLAATMAQKGLQVPHNPENHAAIYISFASQGRSGLFPMGEHLYPWFLPSAAMNRSAAEAGDVLRKGIAMAGGRVLGDTSNSYSTVHVFGSLPLGATQVLDARGSVRHTGGRVFVRDASMLPSHPLVNPQGPLLQLVSALEEAAA